MTQTSDDLFLASYDPSPYDKPSVAVDVVILTMLPSGRLGVMLVQRTEPPFQGQWSLPGGFIRLQESLDEAAERILREKGGLEQVYLQQLYTFGAVDRDPRMRILSVSYFALVEHSCLPTEASLFEVTLDTALAVLTTAGEPLTLAFDHAQIVQVALERIRGQVEYRPIGFELLPTRFTLRQLQRVHEAILGRPLNTDSFRRKLLASGQVRGTGELERETPYRPAEWYERR